MNILHIIHNLEQEGAQVVLYNLATQKSDYKHIVCAWKSGGALEKTMQDDAVDVFVAPKLNGITAIPKVLIFISSIIAMHDIDVIHTHMSDSAFLGNILSIKHRIPFIITHHCDRLVPESGHMTVIFRRLLLMVNARNTLLNVAISEPVKKELMKKLYIGENKISVVENGVPISPGYDRGNLQKKEGRYSIVVVGRLVDIKGQKQIIDAMPGIMKCYPNVKLTILGGGSLEQTLKEQVRLLGIGKNIIFLGVTSNVTAYLDKADIYVTTSHYEGIPMATLEAMASGVPIVASDVVGNRDVITHEETGLLYKLGDVNELTKRVLYLFDNPKIANCMAVKAKSLVESKYSVELMSRCYEDIYTRLKVCTS